MFCRFPNTFGTLVVILVTALPLASAARTAHANAPLTLGKYEPPGDKVYHGAGLPDTWSESGLANQMRAYQAASGKKLSVITWFASVYEMGKMTSWRQSYAPVMARVKRVGAYSLIKFSTQDYAYNQTKRMATMPQIASGAWDAYFVEAALAVKEFGGPIFISINHEMNGTWYPYSEGYPGSGHRAADFVNAWRRIVAIFRQQGASNAAFVWAPNVPDVGPVPFTSYYPGDDVVDWIGPSFYSGNRIEAMDTLYRTYAAKKPFFITEWATAPEKSQYYVGYPGDSVWVAQVFAALQKRYPRVKAISWFNWDKDDGNHRLERVPDQARAYAADIAHPRYMDRLAPANPRGEIERPRLDVPSNEIILREIPAVQTNTAVAPKRERIKLQIVPTERINIQR